MTTSRTVRLATAVLAGGLGVLPLAACSFTSHNVSCDTSSCSVTLRGDGAEVDILGTTLSLDSVEGGRASITVGERGLSCAEGEQVSAGPLSLECTSVTNDSVQLTASLD